MKAILTLLVAVAFVVSPLISEPFTGFRADQLPIAQVDPPVQPAGYAFAIWGLLYLWLLVSAVYGVIKRRDDPDCSACYNDACPYQRSVMVSDTYRALCRVVDGGVLGMCGICRGGLWHRSQSIRLGDDCYRGRF